MEMETNLLIIHNAVIKENCLILKEFFCFFLYAIKLEANCLTIKEF
jgi:hypothetical protein